MSRVAKHAILVGLVTLLAVTGLAIWQLAVKHKQIGPVAIRPETAPPTPIPTGGSQSALFAVPDTSTVHGSKPAVEIIEPHDSSNGLPEPMPIAMSIDDSPISAASELAEPENGSEKVTENIGQTADRRAGVRAEVSADQSQSILSQSQVTPIPDSTAITSPRTTSLPADNTQTNTAIVSPTMTPDFRLTAGAAAPAVAIIAPIQDRSGVAKAPSGFNVPLPTATYTESESLVITSVAIPSDDATYTLAETLLYAAPTRDSKIIRSVPAGTQLTIVARHTTGNWYLLVDGYWVAVEGIVNPPNKLPLVVATVTPTPTSSPTVTPTDTPIPPPTEPPTVTPTPTSLEAPICACQSDQFECLSSYFPSQVDAQMCFEYCFRQTGMDIHNLDPNLNGRACENLQ